MSTVSAPLSTVLEPLDRDHRRDLSTATRYLPFYTVTVDQTVDSLTACSEAEICPLSTVYSRIQSREERGKSGRVSGEVFASAERVDGRHATSTAHRGSVRGQGTQGGWFLRDRLFTFEARHIVRAISQGNWLRRWREALSWHWREDRDGTGRLAAERGRRCVSASADSRPGRLTPMTPGRTAHV